MKKKQIFRVLLFVIICTYSVNTYSQPRSKIDKTTNRRQAKPIKPLDQLGSNKWEWGIECDCPSKPIILKPSKVLFDNNDRRWKYKEYVCHNCSIAWIIKVSADTNDLIRGPYIPKRKDKIIHTIAKKDSCYTIDSIPEGNKYRYIIRAKDCDKTLWITLKDEPGQARYIGKGEATSYLSTPGVRKEGTISHVQPKAGTAVKP